MTPRDSMKSLVETTNKDLGKDLAARAATILVKDAEITRMGQSIHDKDADITRMGQSIHDKDAEIARLGEMIEAISRFADNKNQQARNNNQEWFDNRVILCSSATTKLPLRKKIITNNLK